MSAAFQIARLLAVLVLLIVAACLATPPGRLPLALRGVYRILRRDRGLPEDAAKMAGVAPTGKRLLAFALVLVAAVLALV